MTSASSRLYRWAIVSALAGFLFGFDTVVISGAEKTIQALWSLSPELHGLAIGAALWGTVLGSCVGSVPTDRFGRKLTLLGVGMLFLVGSVWSALAQDVYSFMAARFLGGIAIGVSTVVAPLYISEISPPASRGRLAGMFQFNIVFGILVALLSNYLLAGVGADAWRWMLGVMAAPALLYTLACLTIPESPRWLIAVRGDTAGGRDVLRSVYPDAPPAELDAIVAQIAAAGREEAGAGGFWSRQLRTPILLAVLIAVFNQLSGINAILYFAPRIFELTGSENALAQSIGIGATNLVFTFVGVYLIDRLGRRTLLYVGSVGYILSLGLCAYSFFTWAAPFKAAAAAADVKAAARAVAEASDADRGRRFNELTARKDALIAAAAVPAAGTPRVTFGMGSPADDVRDADAALRQASDASGPGGLVVLVSVFAFIAAHAVGQGAVIWVFISEIFPTRYRASGQSLGSFTHWIIAALLTTAFPVAVAAFSPGFLFLFFAVMMCLQLVWVRLMVPETKGRTFEEIQAGFGRAG